jgi:beta-lactamase regulating signal transducer with metallopeptidase domain
MVTYIIKSTVSLIVLYGFFHFFLRHHKILIFNRFYLISSLVFSLIIPFVNIPVKSDFTLTNSLDKFTFITGHAIQVKEIIGNSTSVFTYQNVLLVLYGIISLVLLIRFTLNILRIIRKILGCKKLENVNTSLVLVEEKTLPYSFLRYVFVNKSDFENSKIEKELLMHEEAHCSQYHSVDIVMVEFINVFFWFNPAIWLFRKAILLNHEYYADNRVLADSESFGYHKLLVNLVVQNNTNYLVSNFKYSLVKNRLIMMTKSRPLHNASLRKIATIPLFLILAIILTFCQKVNQQKYNAFNYQDEWWYPILKKHNVVPHGFNNFDRIFEMGTKNMINDRVVTLENAYILSRPDNNGYFILKSPLAYHDLDKNTISGDDGIMETYNLKSEDIKPAETLHMKNFIVQFDRTNPNIKADSIIYRKK